MLQGAKKIHQVMLMSVSFQVTDRHIYYCGKLFYIQMSFYTHKERSRICDETVHLAFWALRGSSVNTIHPPNVHTIKPSIFTHLFFFFFLNTHDKLTYIIAHPSCSAEN